MKDGESDVEGEAARRDTFLLLINVRVNRNRLDCARVTRLSVSELRYTLRYSDIKTVVIKVNYTAKHPRLRSYRKL